MRSIFKIFVALAAISLVFSEDDVDHPHFKTIPAKNPEEATSEYWYKSAQKTLSDKLEQQLNENAAKNIIFFIGDGMDFTTTAATRMYLGAEEKELSFETFPHFGMSVTYCVDRKVADSACSATAYLTGVKANYGTIGVNANVKRYDCEAALNANTQTESIIRWAQNEGKATGFVTTTKVTHATPAGVYSHIANRYWENDAEVALSKCDPKVTDDIAEQLIHGQTGANLKVIMGGGRKELLDKTLKDEEGHMGVRTDGQNLIETWQKLQNDKNRKFEYVWNKTALNKVDDETEYLMGLFESDHCRYNLDIQKEELKEEPTLTEMVEAAIKVLKKDGNGFFLFVEGGRIDTAHHDAFVQHALEETAEMARAVEKAVALTNSSETLIVVSADHGHTLTYNGYAPRGNDILGLAGVSDEDDIPYTTLSYANGPGYANTYNENAGGRKDPSKQPLRDLDFRFPATVPLNTESHGGAHVGVWAKGPFSHIFVGNYEQNAIPYLMAYAGKIGPYGTGSAFISVVSPLLIVIGVFTAVRHLFI